MIRSLYIKNIAVAKDVEVEFLPGFTAVTGETGSGKSVMVDCFGLIAGSKASREMIRSGEKSASVSAVFSNISESPEHEDFTQDENGEILITRNFTSDSRTSLKVNGKPEAISELKQFAPHILGISSQSEREYLNDRRELIDLLDSYAGNEELLSSYTAHYDVLRSLVDELE
jgi:DNA repair protein RecN (Recombination protein N)